MNTNELIVNAYYLSEIVSRELEEVSGSQLADGLRMLNGILAEKSAKGYQIPYYTETEFNTVIGQEEYFVQGLIDVSTVTCINSTPACVSDIALLLFFNSSPRSIDRIR